MPRAPFYTRSSSPGTFDVIEAKTGQLIGRVVRNDDRLERAEDVLGTVTNIHVATNIRIDTYRGLRARNPLGSSR